MSYFVWLTRKKQSLLIYEEAETLQCKASQILPQGFFKNELIDE